MKHSFKALSKLCAIFAVLAIAASCTDKDPLSFEKTLTFEGGSWVSLIDSPQYGGPLLYGEAYTVESEWGSYTSYYGNPYSWIDSDNTLLTGGTVESYGAFIYWNGGSAISHYAGNDLTKGTSENQLTVYSTAVADGTSKGGNNSSDNFCVHTGNATVFAFSDKVEREIKSMYVNNTLYTVSVLKNGNYYCPAISAGECLKVVATGYNASGVETGKSEFKLADGPSSIVTEWTKWDLSSLGKVASVSLSFEGNGNLTGEYGLNAPAYVAIDDVTVIFE